MSAEQQSIIVNKQTAAENQSLLTDSSSVNKNSKQIIPCPNFDEKLNPELMDCEMDIDLKTSKSLTGKQYILAIPITQFFRNVRNMYALINILNGQSIISLRLIEYFVVNYVLENNTFFDINRYNKHPEYLINNLRGKCLPISEPVKQVVMDKHTAIQDLSQNISAQQLAYKTARAEIVADIKAKAAAATGRAANSKKNNISIDTFFNMKQIANHAAQYNLQGTEKNFDNYIIVHDNYKCQLKEYNKKNFDPFCRWNRIRLYYDKNKFFYTTIAQLNFFKWAIEKHILDYVIENLETIEKSMNEYEKNVKAEKQQRKAKQAVASTNESCENTTSDSGKITKAENQTNGNLSDCTESAEPQSGGNNELLPISLLSTRKTKKRKIVLANPEVKSKVKERKKKEFTKTNRSILFFSAYKVVSFD